MGILDAPSITMAQVARQNFGLMRGPICAGRPLKMGSFTGLTGVTFQGVDRLLFDALQIRLAFPLFGLPGSNNLTPEQFGGPLTIKASVIWNYNNGVGGTSIPVTFGAQRTITTTVGIPFVVSDPIDVPPSQATGSFFVLRTYITQTPRTITDGSLTSGGTTITSATASFINADLNAPVSGTGIQVGTTIIGIISPTQATMSLPATATNTGVTITITPKHLALSRTPAGAGTTGIIPPSWTGGEGYIAGDFTDSAGNSWGGATNDGATMYAPFVLGWPKTGRNRTTLIVGDSIAAGSNWGIYSGAFSYLSWALDQANIGTFNVAHSGEQLTTVLSAYPNYRARLGSAYGMANAIDQYGANDLYAAGRTLAQLKADKLVWWSYLAAKGCAVFATTLLPDTTSTDSWRTVSGQTLLNSGANTTRQSYNAWLMAPATAGPGNSALADAPGILTGTFDPAATLEVNADGTLITRNPSTGAINNGVGGFWYIETTVYETGTVTSIPSSTKLADTTKTWTVNQWTDYVMVITADPITPAAVGQVRLIAVNTATQLTTDTPWVTTPSTSATYTIIKIFSSDGVHPYAFGHKRAAVSVDTTRLA